jgi:hypothetical protein
MPYAAHRHGDLRTCGATTKVSHQTTVFVNNKLWAVEGDENTDGEGDLIAVTGDTVFIGERLVIVHGPDNAFPDSKCPIPGGQHCTPFTAQGSGDTFIY